MTINSMVRRGVVRRGMTLPELLIASSITAMVVAALGLFSKAVLDGSEYAAQAGTATQASRVVTTRIANRVAKSHRVIRLPEAIRAMREMDQVLVVWDRDGVESDTAPGEPNFVELVIFAPSKVRPTHLLELRPKVDPALVAPLDQPANFYAWMNRFRSEQDIEEPPAMLLADLAGVHFEIEEYAEPEGLGGVVQQNVRIGLYIASSEVEPSVYFASAMRRYAEPKESP